MKHIKPLEIEAFYAKPTKEIVLYLIKKIIELIQVVNTLIDNSKVT